MNCRILHQMNQSLLRPNVAVRSLVGSEKRLGVPIRLGDIATVALGSQTRSR